MPFRTLFVAVLTIAAAAAEPYARAGILRGRLDSAVTGRSGDLRVHTDRDAVELCRYDSLTYIERHGHRVDPPALQVGDQMEIVADKKAAAPCYARTVRVASPELPRDGRRTRLRTSRPVIENWMPRGNLTFAGVVLRLNPELMVLRVRDGQEKLILLRPDTRYSASGLPSSAGELQPNTRVFIRGGRNLDQDLEAYHVVWGRIAGP